MRLFNLLILSKQFFIKIFVNKKDEGEIFLTLYKHRKNEGNTNSIDIKYKIGNFVRISKIKKTFEKGYTPN